MAEQDQERSQDTPVSAPAAGNVAGDPGSKDDAEQSASPRLYQAEYVGSGTFMISKPSRSKRKTRQSQLKNPQRGARK